VSYSGSGAQEIDEHRGATGACVGKQTKGEGTMATWKERIEFAASGDKILKCTLSKEELETEFDDGFGIQEGKPFTAWSAKWVYFPAVYDGAEWVARAPRNPCDSATEHVGGG